VPVSVLSAQVSLCQTYSGEIIIFERFLCLSVYLDVYCSSVYVPGCGVRIPLQARMFVAVKASLEGRCGIVKWCRRKFYCSRNVYFCVWPVGHFSVAGELNSLF
jgi:hypothetical protein